MTATTRKTSRKVTAPAGEFCLIPWQDALATKLLAIYRKHGRKGNFIARVTENKAAAELEALGYTTRQADRIVYDVIEVVALQRHIDRHEALQAEIAAITGKGK